MKYYVDYFFIFFYENQKEVIHEYVCLKWGCFYILNKLNTFNLSDVDTTEFTIYSDFDS